MKAATTEAPARAPAAAGGRARETAAPPSGEAAAGIAGGVLTLQRQAGNMAVGRLLAGLPAASGERQANATADAATGRRRRPRGEWLSIGPTAMRDVPASVVEVLGRQGHPLDGGLRMEFEQQVGTALGSVWIHTDARAAASARDLGARAYAFGPHVVFGTGRFAPATADGHWLLAHELTHVAQQRRGGVPALQLAPEGQGGAGTEADDGVIKTILLGKLRDLALPPLGLRLAFAAGMGMGDEVVTELKGAKGVALLGALRSFRLGDVGELNRGFGVGLVSGIVSPVTDLFSIAVLAERLRNLLIGMIANPASAREGLADDVQALLAEVGKLSGSASEVWKEITKSPKDALIFILKLPDKLSEEAEAKAYGLGKAGGAEVVDSMLQPFGLGTPEKQEEKPSWLTSTAAAIEATAKGGKDWLVGRSPWAKIGEKLGYALGWVAIQVVLFAFTDGIGDAIQWLAQGLGKIAKALGTFSEVVGRVAAKVAEAAKAIGEGIAFVEEWFGKILAKLLKPAEKFLEPLLEKLGGVREKLRTVLEKLFGITRKEADKVGELAAAKAAKATTGTVDEALERATPKGGARTAPEPKPVGDTSEALTTTVKKEPEPPPAAGGAGERVVTKPPEPVREPVKGGHHVEAAPEGIELCSTEPCPLLGVIYRKELEANEELATRLAALEKLRATDPKAAAKAAAELRESLEFIRMHPDLFEALPSHVTPQQQARLAELLRRAEDSGAQIGETEARNIAAELGERKDTGAVTDALDALEADLRKLEDPFGEAGKIGGGSREGDLARELPEGTQALNPVLKNPQEVNAFLKRYPKVKASPQSEGTLDALFESTKSGGAGRTPWTGRYLPKRTGPAAGELESIVELSSREEVEAIELVPSSYEGRTADKIIDVRQPDGSIKRMRYEDRTTTGVGTKKGTSDYRPRGQVVRKRATPGDLKKAVTSKVESTVLRPSQFESLMVDVPEGGILAIHVQNASPTVVQDVDKAMTNLASVLKKSKVEAVEFYVPTQAAPLRYVRAPDDTFSLLGAAVPAGTP